MLDEIEVISEIGAATALTLYGARFVKPAAALIESLPNLGWKSGAAAEAGLANTAGATSAAKTMLPAIRGSKFAQIEGAAEREFLTNTRSLFKAPEYMTGYPEDNARSLAERAIRLRFNFTGQKVTESAIATEQARLEALNPMLKGLPSWHNAHFKYFDRPTVEKITFDLRHRFVPNVGEYLKADGKITGKQLEEALAHQRSMRWNSQRRTLPEVLLDKGFVKQRDLDAAFNAQNSFVNRLENSHRNFKFFGDL